MHAAEINPFKCCVRCGQPVVGALPDGWYGWCPVCREGWLRWWKNPNSHRRSGSHKLRFRP